MTNEPLESEVPGIEDTSFLSKKEDTSVYSDFFQETSDGKISVGTKAQKSGLELVTTIFSYVLPIAIVGVILGSIHVFLRSQETSGFTSNYPFLCPYMNYGVDIDATARGCNTITKIGTNYTEKQKQLEENILKKLNEYIPIKITKNLMATSPEKLFVMKTYEDKIRVDTIMNQFQNVVAASQYKVNNIQCTGISIDNNGVLTTQCTIDGKDIGADDTNGGLGSSRLEALSFVDALNDTAKNHFILLNAPTTLSSDKITDTEGGGFFTTRTTLPIQARYVPFDEKS